MPKITDIAQQKNRADRYSISVDGKYAFPMSANGLLASGLYMGQELTEAELEEVKTYSEQSKAYDQALNFISLRKRSRREVADYLKRKTYEAQTIDRTLLRLTELKFIDDSDFAQSWVRDRQQLKPRSKRVLEQELRQKGIDREIVEQVLADLSDEEELATIRQLASKKLTQAKYQDQQKLINYLVGQGFTYSLVKRALTEED